MKKSRLFYFSVLLLGLVSSCTKDSAGEGVSKLNAPANLTVETASITQTSMRLTWTVDRSDLVTSYTVAYAESDVRNFYEKECFEPQIVLSGLEPETEYVFKVRANTSGSVESNSVWSDEVTASTLAPVVPDVPLNLRSLPEEISSTRLGVAWDASEGAVKYFVSYKKESDEAFTELETQSTELLLEQLEVKTPYLIKVRAWSEIGYSDFTTELTVSTLSRSEGIFNAEDFVAFATGAADGGDWRNESGEVMIRRDIDLSGVEWIPMAEFTGVLDGSDKTISNLTCRNDDLYVGLIGVLKGTIRNLTLDETCTFESTRTAAPTTADEVARAGAFAGVVEQGGLQHCVSRAAVKVGHGCSYVGGLVGLSRGTDDTRPVEITSCTHAGTVSLAGNISWIRSVLLNLNLGGVVGSAEAGTIVNGCHNQGTIQCNNSASAASNRMPIYIGGISGYASEASIIACTNDVTGQIITLTNPHYSRIGGILGYGQGTSVTDCDNYGSFSLTASADPATEYEIGGIVGRSEFGTGSEKLLLTGCSNYSDLTVETRAGANKQVMVAGIAGYLNFGTLPFEVSDCRNEGNFQVTATTSTSLLGGIVGGIEAKAEGVIEHCTNQGDITTILTSSKAFHVGGIVGVNKSTTATVRQCSNSGNLNITNTQKAYGGGIVGEAQGCTVEDCSNSGYVHVLYNEGDVTHIGGIVARTYRGAKIRNCVNSGTIVYGGTNPRIGEDKTGGFGGIVGYLDKDNAVVDGCTNTGTILGDKDNLGKKGAICGWASPDGPTSITNCIVQGRVGNYDATAEDLGISAALELTPENYSQYIYGGKIAELTETGNVFTK